MGILLVKSPRPFGALWVDVLSIYDPFIKIKFLESRVAWQERTQPLAKQMAPQDSLERFLPPPALHHTPKAFPPPILLIGPLPIPKPSQS